MEIFKLFGSIFVDNEKANKSIHQTESIGSKAFTALGNGIKTLAKVGTAGAVAFAGGVAALTKSAVDNYSEYEQLVGGIETLFKNSQNIVMEYANNAYKTAGMNANEYMETVTSFSASLLQGLGGDTEKAAKIADMAITDMSDNANKMGTSMELIQNAYNGFSKSNFTMLDNLKLGYGGTKTEMERLLKDAEKLSGIKYDISNLGDIYEAIHVIQTEMGITGTTAKEAGETLAGSFTMMQKSWENLVVGMADPEQDISILIKNVVDSGVTYLNNLIPRIVETVPRIVGGLGTVIGTIGMQLPTLLSQLLPPMIDGGETLVNGLFNAFTTFDLNSLVTKGVAIMSTIGDTLENNLPMVTTKAVVMIGGFADNLTDNLSIILQSGFNLLLSLMRGILNALPTLIDIIPTIIKALAQMIVNNLPIILQCGFDIVVALGLGLLKAVPKLVEVVIELITWIVNTWEDTDWKKLATDAMNAIKEKLKSTGEEIKTTVKDVFQKVYNSMKEPMEKGKKKVKEIIDSIKGFFNFKISFPNIPLPHFGITPKGWQVGDLLKGKIPKLGIEWYEKGAILTGPTAFDVSPMGNLRVGGEAGHEAVAPIDLLLDYIRTAVNESNNLMADRLQNLILMLSEYLPQLANMQIVLDSGALVGQLSTGIDIELGNIQRRKGR